MYKTITTNIMVENVADTIEFYQKKLEFEIVLTVPEAFEKFGFAIFDNNKNILTISCE